jgi:hypothetical protein
MIQNAGSQAIAGGTDAVIGTSGKPTRVFAISFLSDGTAGVFILRNGTSTAGNPFVQENGVVSAGKTVTYGTTGIMFPAGCFMDIDTHVMSGVVEYAQEGS